MKRIGLIFSCFVILLAPLACDISTDSDASSEDTTVEPFDRAPPVFYFSSGTSAPYNPAEEINPQDEFCEMYLSSDAFIWGVVENAEIIRTPYVTATGWSIVENVPIEDCYMNPAFKLQLKTTELYSDYGLTAQQYEHVSLYVGPHWFGYMVPEPLPELRSIENSDVCEKGHSCRFVAGQRVGFFAQHNQKYNVWYLSAWAFWSPIRSIEETQYVGSWLLKSLLDKSSMRGITEAMALCEGYQSDRISWAQEAEARQSQIENALPRCYIK